MRGLKLELKVFVGYLLCDLKGWLPYTENGSVEIRIVVNGSRIYHALRTVEQKIHWRYLYFFNCATFYEGVEYFFGFTKTIFRVAHDNLNHVPMEGLGSKPLRIHSGFF